jgi:hypothetical protein
MVCLKYLLLEYRTAGEGEKCFTGVNKGLMIFGFLELKSDDERLELENPRLRKEN